MNKPIGTGLARIDAVFCAVLGCFVLSGFAALLYQTAWMRQFSIVFGTSELAVATVLASYMAGLAAGSAVAARVVRHIRRPVWVYGVLELGVAIGALAVPVLLGLVRQLEVAILGGQPAPPDAGGVLTSLFYLLCAFLLLALPTGCMGATLPMLTRHAVQRQEQIGSRVGLLYALNTAGAVAGTLTAAFVLLPALGLWTTLLVGAAINILIFGLAALVSRLAAESRRAAVRQAPAPSETLSKPKATKPSRRRRKQQAALSDSARGAEAGATGWLDPWCVLPIMLLSGAISFAYEVVWTRLLSHILGGSVFAFATMLAAFLSGITLGSAVAARLARTRSRSAVGLGVAQLGTALLSIGIYLSLDRLPAVAIAAGVGEHAGLARQVILAIAVLLPATLCIGATFPFAVRVLARDEEDAAPASARVYAWNTVGAIVGAVATGFWLLPEWEFAGMVWLAVVTNLLLAVAACLLADRTRRWIAWTVVAASVLVLLLFHPTRPEWIVRASPFATLGTHDPDKSKSWLRGKIVFFRVGRSSTVMVLRQGSFFYLRNNGLPESSIALRGCLPDQETARLLTALPVLARPAAKKLLIIGLGGGVAVNGVPPSVGSIDAIELEPQVVEANKWIASRRLTDPLRDPRLHIVLNDARSSLALTDKHYDLIVSQPSHPWTAGASHLYTLEFIRMARDHLKPGGLFVQWMHADFVDHVLLKSLGATLLAVFPHVELYAPMPGVLIFLGSDGAIEPEEALRQSHDWPPAMAGFYRQYGICSAADVLSMLALDEDGLRRFCSGAPITTDDLNFMATGSPQVMANPLGAANADRIMRPFDPLVRLAAASTSGRQAGQLVYLVRRLYLRGFLERAMTVADKIASQPERLFAQAILAKPEQARQKLRKVLELQPGNTQARFALALSYIGQVAAGRSPPQLRSEIGRLEGAEKAVVEGWKLAGAGRWAQLAQLDSQLATADPTDFCYGQAAHLRALWRIQLASGPDQRRQGQQAMEILDQGLLVASPIQPILNYTTEHTRLEAALMADRPDAALESARWFVQWLRQTAPRPEDRKRKAHQAACKLLLARLARLRADGRLDESRVDEVTEGVRELEQ